MCSTLTTKHQPKVFAFKLLSYDTWFWTVCVTSANSLSCLHSVAFSILASNDFTNIFESGIS